MPDDMRGLWQLHRELSLLSDDWGRCFESKLSPDSYGRGRCPAAQHGALACVAQGECPGPNGENTNLQVKQ